MGLSREPRDWTELRAHLDRSIEASARRLGVCIDDPTPEPRPPVAPPVAMPVPRPRRERKRKREPAPRHPDRELLSRIVRETAPHHCRSEIRRRYTAATGRPISYATVAEFAIKVMGLPKILPGAHAGGVEAAEARRSIIRRTGSPPGDRPGPI